MSALQTAIEMAPPLLSVDTLLAALVFVFMVLVWLGFFFVGGLIVAATVESIRRLVGSDKS